MRALTRSLPRPHHHSVNITSRTPTMRRALFVYGCRGSLCRGLQLGRADPGASAGNKPTVVVQSPTNGAVLPVGGNVAVTGAASDTVGVDHVSLFADGVSVASSPSGTAAPLVPFSLTWLATPAGPHVLQVIAYRADGTPSDPSVLNVVVGGSASFPVISGGSLPPFSFVPATQPGSGHAKADQEAEAQPAACDADASADANAGAHGAAQPGFERLCAR